MKCLGVLLVAAFLCAVTAAAQERPTASPEPAAPASTASARSESGSKAGCEGIEVHGHWTIEVRNPDGTVASHNEFEDECFTCKGVLALVLGRKMPLSIWRVFVSGTGGPSVKNGQQYSCALGEAAASVQDPPDPDGNYFKTLVSEASNLFVEGGAGGICVLSGSCPVAVDGAIWSVSPSPVLNEPSPYVLGFTNRILASPIQVAAGQTVYVKVTLSFS